MAIIKTLKDFLTKTTLYPITKTQAVYDDTVGRLDSYLQNTLGAEPIDDTNEESTDLIDADTLGGRYTAEDLDAMPKSTAIEDYANIEPPINDADRLGGKYTSKDIEQEFIKLNSSLSDIGKFAKLLEDSGAFSKKTVSLLDSIANYKELLFYMTDGSTILQTIILPVDLYRIQGNVAFYFTVKGGSFSVQTYYAKYIDDNTIQMEGYDTEGRGITIYGIK